jgi:hypothetical protein
LANWIDYILDVLADSPAEVGQISERLNSPSRELAAWVAGKFGGSTNEVDEFLQNLLKFKAVKDLSFLGKANTARRFSLLFKRYSGIVDSHLAEVSEAFPRAVFLLEYFDMQASYSGKRVIRAGQVIQEIHDGHQQSQAMDWVLVDIFAPFTAEYQLGLEFGSLWKEWMSDLTVAVQELKGKAE